MILILGSLVAAILSLAVIIGCCASDLKQIRLDLAGAYESKLSWLQPLWNIDADHLQDQGNQSALLLNIEFAQNYLIDPSFSPELVVVRGKRSRT